MTEITEKKKKAVKKSVTPADLDQFREEICNILDERFNMFIKDFLDAWDDSAEPVPDKCTCGDEACSCEKEPMPENPKRYLIQSGGTPWWVDSYKPNPVYGIDVFWTEEVNGKIKNVRGTIMDANVSIFDFESDVTPEMFENMRKQTVDYAIQMAQEAREKEKAMKDVEGCAVAEANHVSYG